MIEALEQLPPLVAHHVLLAAAALALALAIGLPLGVAAARRPRLAAVALGLAGLVQTIPGLALLALFYPLLLAFSALVGGRIPALGFLPAWLALALYALLPILRNVVAGLRGIDPAVMQAADGVGMTPRQRLRLVELPLAAPVAMAGIRTATVWTIGAATLATTIGYPSLGNPIFAGLQTENWTLVLAGCVGAAALAIVADALLGQIEQGLARRRPRRVAGAAALLLAGLIASVAPLFGGGTPTVIVGAKNFSEQFILARLIGDRLERAGYRVTYREGLGSAVAFQALSHGDIDVYVDYAGTLWTGAMGRHDIQPRAAMLATIGDWMKSGPHVGLVGPLGFENAYALATRPGRGLTTIADLAPRAPGLTLGADLEFLDRPEWRAIRDAYGLRFAATRAYSPTFMYRALASGQADVISAFSSDGRIAADHLTVLADPRGAIPRYDALLLVAPARASDPAFVRALQPLIGAIPVERMRTANYMVDRDADKATPVQAARWLASPR
ncbi:ABC transporter permease/substrate-binding protein [Sphingomonas nostoxanthinifaciens]|uniref:ABC transporter permease/substrate-binding protein n=1 Tax=Sphingomonas nostoxanthinifaciens TaxID=2872652 RepID=UPI001CC1E760|nr:glycine betaine ABC transporter substrate-binding protein [Sphingomonas nostoxanthinifaciens]UAK24408.1 ABC transporter permease subunit [Sphingomonas nostoxanthinifaciens]